MSRWRKKSEDEEVEITKGGREFHNKTVDGRNDASRRDLLQSITLLLLRAGEIPVLPWQRYRAVQWLHCHLRGHMYPTFGSLQPEFVEHSTWGCLVAGHWAKLATSVV